MSSLPVADSDFEVRSAHVARAAIFSPRQAAACAAFLALAGATSIWSTVLYLWALWTTDALKSIGMVIPLVSGILIFRVWRTLDFEMSGTWGGAVLLAITVAAVHLRDQSVLVLILSPSWSIYLPPHSLVAFAYTAGVVLLFGGRRLFRAALFPIVLMWFVNPIPHVFNVVVDLPLQRVSAHVARAFAIALGQPLSPDQMRLMFTPDFGMFIAPGCNGIRGAVTMGFIALIAGYLYRFRWFAHAAVVAAAVFLGYVFNFVRLCTLVLYYIVALKFPWLQNRAEMGDYLIGAGLFLFATVLLFSVIARLREVPGQVRDQIDSPLQQFSCGCIGGASHSCPFSLKENGTAYDLPLHGNRKTALAIKVASASASHYARMAFLFLLAAFGSHQVARATIHGRPVAAASSTASTQNALGEFPHQLGPYTLVRLWNENLVTGPLIFHWAEYAPADGGTHISIGVSPVLGSHDTLICHSARGEDPLWHDQLTLPTATKITSFSASFYNDGATQFLEATTLCNGNSCGEYSSPTTHFGLVYSKPDPTAVFSQDPIRPIPILLRAETIETTIPADLARSQMTTAIRTFVAFLNLDTLTQPYRHP